ELMLHARCHGKQNCFGQVLFAIGDSLLNPLRVVGVRPEFQELLIMKNRRGRIRFFFFVQTSELNMGRSGIRIYSQRLFKFFDGSAVIHTVETSLASDVMGFFLLLQLTARGIETAAQAGAEQNRQHTLEQPRKKRHAASLVESAATRNEYM